MGVPLRYSIKEPIPAIFQAGELLSHAADAQLGGDFALAETLFRQANLPEVFDWAWTDWKKPALNVRVPNPDGDTKKVPETERDPIREPTRNTKAVVVARDGYRCRYCGIPVIDADIRKIVHKLYPDAVPWVDRCPEKQHAAFSCFWLQYDHVVPHSHGGRSSEDNIVVCCAICNFGKDGFTLKQLDIADPRLRQPEPVLWDGLERLRIYRQTLPKASPIKKNESKAPAANSQKIDVLTSLGAFFLPGARISSGYLLTPPIAGKERWFELAPDVIAEPAVRDGVEGCSLRCDPALFQRRGLSPQDFLDPEYPF